MESTNENHPPDNIKRINIRKRQRQQNRTKQRKKPSRPSKIQTNIRQMFAQQPPKISNKSRAHHGPLKSKEIHKKQPARYPGGAKEVITWKGRRYDQHSWEWRATNKQQQRTILPATKADYAEITTVDLNYILKTIRHRRDRQPEKRTRRRNKIRSRDQIISAILARDDAAFETYENHIHFLNETYDREYNIVLPAGITPRKRGILKGDITAQAERSWYTTQPILPQAKPTNTQKQPSNQREPQAIREEGYNQHNWRKGERFWVSGGHLKNFYLAYPRKYHRYHHKGSNNQI